MDEIEVYQSDYSAEQIDGIIEHGVPYINSTNDHWMRWDVENQVYVDTGVVARGPQGPSGKSAYAAAQEAGYIGTEAEFNAALAEVEDKLNENGDGQNVTVTFTQASALDNISTGEKLSVMFGKIAKAIADFILHLSNTSNPHSVTAAQVGAVPQASGSLSVTFGRDANGVYVEY